jgi:hypothetical protein
MLLIASESLLQDWRQSLIVKEAKKEEMQHLETGNGKEII